MKFGAILIISCLCIFHVQSAEINADIFEDLDFLSLVNVPTPNHVIFSKVFEVFQQKYGKKVLKIHGPISDKDTRIFEFSDSIMISDLKLVYKVFNKFGSALSKIEVNFELFNAKDHKEIIQRINSLNSVVDLALQKCKGNLFKEISEAFISVENLRLQGELDTLKSATLQFNELFPALRMFDCAYLYIGDGKSIEQKFPHLEHLYVAFLRIAFSESNIEHLMQMNPQITTLKLRYNTPEFVTKVSKYLPKLEKFTFELKSSNQPEIYMPNVKEVKISMNAFYSPRKLNFEQLETIELEYRSPITNTWIMFIKRNKHLKTLIFTDAILNDEQLQHLGGMEHLTKVNINCDEDVSVETVFDFLESCPKLEKAFLKNLDSYKLNVLRNRLSGAWKLISFNPRKGNDVYFVRKN